MGVDITLGYVFRTVNGQVEVLADPISYSVVYDCLKHYLSTIGVYNGETSHGLRGGCAVTLTASGVASSVKDLMMHMGWRTQATPDHYARSQVAYSKELASRFSSAIGTSSVSSAKQTYKESDFDSLPLAF